MSRHCRSRSVRSNMRRGLFKHLRRCTTVDAPPPSSALSNRSFGARFGNQISSGFAGSLLLSLIVFGFLQVEPQNLRRSSSLEDSWSLWLRIFSINALKFILASFLSTVELLRSQVIRLFRRFIFSDGVVKRHAARFPLFLPGAVELYPGSWPMRRPTRRPSHGGITP